MLIRRLFNIFIMVVLSMTIQFGSSFAAETAVVSASAEEKEDFNYSGRGRRDPFKPLVEKVRPAGPTRTTPLEPLEKFTLGQLKVKAVLLGFKVPRAMILAPDGKSYIVVPGTKIGKNRGVVQGINPDAVLVKETYYDFSGDIRTSVKQIKLPKRKGI